MSQPTPSPTRLTQDTPLSPTQLSPDTPSSFSFPDIPNRNPARNNSTNEPHRPSQNEVTLQEALQQGPVTVPKNPRRLSEFDANLSRRERRKSKAWSGESQGFTDRYGEGEADGRRRRSGPLDAEELKMLVVEKLRRVSVKTVQVV